MRLDFITPYYGYVYLGPQQKCRTNIEFCRFLSQSNVFSSYRINFDANGKPVFQAKTKGLFNPYYRYYGEFETSFEEKEALISNLHAFISHNADAIANDAAQANHPRCDIQKIIQNIEGLRSRFLFDSWKIKEGFYNLKQKIGWGFSDIRKETLRSLFDEMPKIVTLAADKTTTAPPATSTKITALEFINELQKGKYHQYTILKNNDIFRHEDASQPYTFADKVMLAEGIERVMKVNKKELLKQECNVRKIQNSIEKIRSVMLKNISSESFEGGQISTPLTRTLVFLKQADNEKPDFIDRSYTWTKNKVLDATYAVGRGAAHVAWSTVAYPASWAKEGTIWAANQTASLGKKAYLEARPYSDAALSFGVLYMTMPLIKSFMGNGITTDKFENDVFNYTFEPSLAVDYNDTVNQNITTIVRQVFGLEYYSR